MHLCYWLLWFVSADAGFETRQAAEGVLTWARPVAWPVLLAGVRSADAEVRFRCRRALAGSRFWSLVGDAAVRPTAALTMFQPTCRSFAADEDADGQRSAAAVALLFGLPQPASQPNKFVPTIYYWQWCQPLREHLGAPTKR